MPLPGSVIGAWRPKTESERQVVRAQLERIASDSRFTASKRYPSMLRYIVEQTLAENEDNLKERTLGVEVFHRRPDYDTNLDPVVRLCAGEVRKRLAQFYQSPEHAGELRIELNPGSYVPVFSQPPPGAPARDGNSRSFASGFSQSEPDSPALEVTPAYIPPQSEPFSEPKRMRRIHWPAAWVASGLMIAVIGIVGARYWEHLGKRSALDEVWSPLLTGSKPVLFCMGGSRVLTLPGSQLAQLQSGADEDSFHQALVDMNDFVPFSDVQILSRFSSLVQGHGHAFRIQSFQTTVSSQLREGPVVLIGALNNDWTLNRTSSLRFHFDGLELPNSVGSMESRRLFPCGAPGLPACPPHTVYWIADRQHPESRTWQVSADGRESHVLRDYAIAARFTDEATGQVVLVAAGIAGSGTRAAGEFLTDEADLKQLADSAGVDLSRKNFEVVLSSQVVNGIQGKPRVEARTFW